MKFSLLKIWKIIAVNVLFTLPLIVHSQPGWMYHNTGINHTILIVNSIPVNVDGMAVSAGDYLGVFFNTPSGLSCGGYVQWTGTNITLAAWGSEPGQNNGFAANEALKWKIWRASDNQEFDATATYNTSFFPDSGRYVTNGMSGLSSLEAFSPVYLPPWHFTNTGNFHMIEIPAGADIEINNQAINNGDYVGVFYDSSGVQACGGYIVKDENFQYLYAYGQAPPADNGFETGEVFTWKIWRVSDGNEVTAIPVYDLLSFSDSGNFHTGGLSGILSLSGISGPNLGITDWMSPISSCQTFTDHEHISLKIKNMGNVSIDSFQIKLFVNGFLLLDQQSIQTVSQGSTIIFTFSGTVDFSAIDTFECQAEIVLPGDINILNNTISRSIINFPQPYITIDSLALTYCSGSSPVNLQAIPSGGIFYGGSVSNGQFFPNLQGSYVVYYDFTDALTACSGSASQTVSVISSPEIELGPNQEHCFGENILLEVQAGFAHYHWSSGSTTNQMTAMATGAYSVTVTADNGCKDADAVFLTFHPVPGVHISGNTLACQGDTISLDAGDGYDIYMWNDSSAWLQQILHVTESGIYYVKVFLNNCSATDTVNIEFLPLPEVAISGSDSGCTGGKVTLSATEGFPLYFWNFTGDINPVVQVNQTGMYSVMVSNDFGCFGYDSLQVWFFNSPIVDFPLFPDLCQGDTVVLDPGKADSYVWNTGSVSSILKVNESGEYTVTVTSNHCSSSASASLFFYEPPLPSFTYTQTVNEIQFINTSSIADNYLWDFGDSTSFRGFEPDHVYTGTGSYVVSLTMSNACGTRVVADTIDVRHVFSGHKLEFSSINPNPTNGHFSLFLIAGKETSAGSAFYDMNGNQLFTGPDFNLSRGENMLNFDFSSLTDGLYILKLRGDFGQLFYKLIIIN